ncbi:MAG: thioredoxin-dependent thiol peroxidase [Sphingomonadales bacterium]
MTKAIEIGDKAPDFDLPTDADLNASLDAFKGKNIVLYFYPKDDTPGCTKESIAFTALKSEFEKLNTVIIGVSKDTVAKHAKFRAKHDLDVVLASDESGEMIERYGAWVEKNMYGRKYMGIERSTFLIDENGIVRNVWRKVKVKDHAEAVLEAVKAL